MPKPKKNTSAASDESPAEELLDLLADLRDALQEHTAAQIENTATLRDLRDKLEGTGKLGLLGKLIG